MERKNSNYELSQQVAGQSVEAYLANLVEENDKLKIEKERAKISISAIKAITAHSRARMDAAKIDLKIAQQDAVFANLKAELAEARLELEKQKSSNKKK